MNELAVHKKHMVKLIDKENKQITREVPPERQLNAGAHICELAGMFVD